MKRECFSRLGRVVAIDGPSGAGKSTIAKAVARRLGFGYLDTGALYRAIALGLVRAGLAESATDSEIARTLGSMSVEFREGRVYLKGEDVSEDIRSASMGKWSSVFSARGPVREFLLPLQREAARHADLVAEGRDMATVVFKDAWAKFYLDATVEARALRRFNQLKGTPNEVGMDHAIGDVVDRDKRDQGRDLAPLRQASDAIFIDSSALGPEEVVELIIKEAERRGWNKENNR